MGVITKLARMWLTRTTKPFLFKNEYDEKLSFVELDNLGLYVHIPFCRSICNLVARRTKKDCSSVFTKNARKKNGWWTIFSYST